MDEDTESLKDILRRGDKPSEPQEEGEMETPGKNIGKLNQPEASSRLDPAGHAPKVAEKKKGKNLKDKGDKNRISAKERSKKNKGGREDRRTIRILKDKKGKNRRLATVRSKTNRVTFGKKRRREDRRMRGATEEKNDPPDKIRQNHGNNDENNEELQENTCRGELKSDPFREGHDKKSARTGVKKQPTALKQDTTTVGGEEKRKEMVDKEETVGESTETGEKRSMWFHKKTNGHESNEDPQKYTRRGKWQSNIPTDGNDDKCGRNAVAKQQAQAKSKEEKMTENSTSLRF